MNPSSAQRSSRRGPTRPQDPLVELGRCLAAAEYRFVTTTPATHARVLARSGEAEAETLRDVFGWNRWFREGTIPRGWINFLDEAGVLEREGERLKSGVRYATIDGQIFVHSGYPTTTADAVFFGPDTYRFVDLLRRSMTTHARRMVEIGCGSGAPAIATAQSADRVTLADVNPRALRYATINATLAGLEVEVVKSDVLASIAGPVDRIIANPPYLVDDEHRIYRDGGGDLGLDLTLRMVDESLARLEVGGTLFLYTATPIIDGDDPLAKALVPVLRGRTARYAEMDPDVFGEELERPAYAAADRIAVVSLIVTRE